MSSLRLKGKVALVTGAGSGFGLAIATRFVAEGATVLLTDLNEASVKQAADQLAADHGTSSDTGGSKVQYLQMNVANAADWERAVERAAELGGGTVDVVVNNAGTTYRNKPTLDVTEEEFDRVFDVNVKSIFWSVKAAVPYLKKNENGGSIINIGSIGSVRPRPGLVWYNASKGAVTNATKGLAAEYGADKIRVNAIAPLLCGTGLFESFVGVPDTPENRQQFIANVPLGRLTETADVASAAVYLASDEGAFITGVNLEVDGGRTI